MQAESSGEGSSFINVGPNSNMDSKEDSGVEIGEAVEYDEEVEYEEVEEEVEEDEEEEEQEEGQEGQEEQEDKSQADASAEATAEPQSSAEAKEDVKDDEDVPSTPPASTSAQEGPTEPAFVAPKAEADESSTPTATAMPSSTAAAPGAGGSSGVDLDLKQLEAQATKVAQGVTQAAKDMSNKLTAGLRSAFGSSEQTTAGASLTKLAGGLSSWWGSLDPAPQPVQDETAERVASSNKASSELQQLFGLSAEENLVEHFKCKMLQTYACSHNAHTPAIQMAFQGTLYVTDRHTCFSVEERGRKLPFKVPHSQMVKATRQRPARKGDLSDILKVELSNGQWLAFKDFESGSSLDSALALVEHLMEGS